MTCPRQAPDETFEAHQENVASWMGYPNAKALNRDHDRLHVALCRWLGITSHSLLCADGEAYDASLAAIEEDAVLATQKLMVQHGRGVPA